MIKRLTAVGNSLAVLIDRPIRDLLGIDRETLLEVTTDGTALVTWGKCQKCQGRPLPHTKVADTSEAASARRSCSRPPIEGGL